MRSTDHTLIDQTKRFFPLSHRIKKQSRSLFFDAWRAIVLKRDVREPWRQGLTDFQRFFALSTLAHGGGLCFNSFLMYDNDIVESSSVACTCKRLIYKIKDKCP